MTSKTSLFNKSIFFNNLRRLWWGSLLYFIILMLVMPLRISMSGISYFTARMDFGDSPTAFDSLLFRSDFSVFVIGLLIVVPVLVSLLLFRYLHVKRQAAVIHSLPVTRLSLFVTNLLSGLVLMYLPILLNGVILLCYSTFGGYCSVMPMASVFAFVGLQLLFTAVLFAVPVFFAMLTGNTILLVIFTYASYFIPVGLCTGISYLMSLVLFGYRDNIAFLEPLFEQIPLFRMISAFESHSGFHILDTVLMLAFTAVLFVLAYLFYRRRNLETAGDAISFQWLKPVFKYLVTVCLCVLVVTYSAALNSEISVLSGVLFLIAAVVAYFGSEMLMRKSFRVFGCWRGLLVFIAVVAVASAGVKADLFGYEKRIPSPEDIVSAAYGTEQMSKEDSIFGKIEGEVSDPQAIQLIIDVHRSIIAHKQELAGREARNLNGETYHRTISYRLKNGKIFTRYYPLDETVIKDKLLSLYSNQEYKRAYFDVARRFPDGNFTSAEIHSAYNNYSMDSDTAQEVYRRILADIDTIPPEDVRAPGKNVLFTVSFIQMNDQKRVTKNADISVTPNFKDTLAYLQEKEIYQRVALIPDNMDKIIISFEGDTVQEITEKEKIQKIIEDCRAGKISDDSYKETYRIIAVMKNGARITLGTSNSPFNFDTAD